jgi:hypothetical protein
MSQTLFRAMRTKVKGLLTVEASMSKEDRQAQQWQLLFTIDNTQYLVGKGGINTMFYTVGSGKRKLCLPHEMLSLLDAWANTKTEWAIAAPDGTLKVRMIADEKAALKLCPPKDYRIVNVVDGKIKAKYTRVKGVTSDSWVPTNKTR